MRKHNYLATAPAVIAIAAAATFLPAPASAQSMSAIMGDGGIGLGASYQINTGEYFAVVPRGGLGFDEGEVQSADVGVMARWNNSENLTLDLGIDVGAFETDTMRTDPVMDFRLRVGGGWRVHPHAEAVVYATRSVRYAGPLRYVGGVRVSI